MKNKMLLRNVLSLLLSVSIVIGEWTPFVYQSVSMAIEVDGDTEIEDQDDIIGELYVLGFGSGEDVTYYDRGTDGLIAQVKKNESIRVMGHAFRGSGYERKNARNAKLKLVFENADGNKKSEIAVETNGEGFFNVELPIPEAIGVNYYEVPGDGGNKDKRVYYDKGSIYAYTDTVESNKEEVYILDRTEEQDGIIGELYVLGFSPGEDVTYYDRGTDGLIAQVKKNESIRVMGHAFRGSGYERKNARNAKLKLVFENADGNKKSEIAVETNGEGFFNVELLIPEAIGVNYYEVPGDGENKDKRVYYDKGSIYAYTDTVESNKEEVYILDRTEEQDDIIGELYVLGFSPGEDVTYYDRGTDGLIAQVKKNESIRVMGHAFRGSGYERKNARNAKLKLVLENADGNKKSEIAVETNGEGFFNVELPIPEAIGVNYYEVPGDGENKDKRVYYDKGSIYAYTDTVESNKEEVYILDRTEEQDDIIGELYVLGFGSGEDVTYYDRGTDGLIAQVKKNESIRVMGHAFRGSGYERKNARNAKLKMVFENADGNKKSEIAVETNGEGFFNVELPIPEAIGVNYYEVPGDGGNKDKRVYYDKGSIYAYTNTVESNKEEVYILERTEEQTSIYSIRDIKYSGGDANIPYGNERRYRVNDPGYLTITGKAYDRNNLPAKNESITLSIHNTEWMPSTNKKSLTVMTNVNGEFAAKIPVPQAAGINPEYVGYGITHYYDCAEVYLQYGTYKMTLDPLYLFAYSFWD